MEPSINVTYTNGERVCSTYAEIYLDDDYCDSQKPIKVDLQTNNKDVFIYEGTGNNGDGEEWASPSDVLIDIIDIKPPFTSKITRAKAHEGILAIGNDILEKERAKFMRYLSELLSENDKSWSYILENQRKFVQDKVKHIYSEIFARKRQIMCNEISVFYERTLQELEDHMRSELKVVLVSAHANIISDLNQEIKQKITAEKIILENTLKKRFISEISKVKSYYNILFDNEIHRYDMLINQALYERNDALIAFDKQIEAENITSTMFIMCTERKKCKIKQFVLNNFQKTDITEKMHKIKEKQHILDAYKKREVHILQINNDWEEQIKKVLILFLKFISFSLKLLPEQTTFLIDFEKLIVLQINEIQKNPDKCPPIVVEEEHIKNIFKFEEPVPEPSFCNDEPFVVMGDMSDPTPPKYGSRETLPDDVDLPFVRLDRQFTYAKCHKFEQVKEFLESQKCQCQNIPIDPVADLYIARKEQDILSTSLTGSSVESETRSLDETLLLNDFERLHHCPARSCQNWVEGNEFPNLNSYLDFTEENFERVKTILGKQEKIAPGPKTIDPKEYVNARLPFSATKERYHSVETQYSSQEELYIPIGECSCVDTASARRAETRRGMKKSASIELNTILQKRIKYLRNILQENPTLLKIFTDECFDFQL